MKMGGFKRYGKRPSVFTLSKDGALAALNLGASERAYYMQALASKHPENIMNHGRGLLLVKREQAIGDGDVAGRRSLDHLFVTRRAVLALVELKRAFHKAAE
jgi:hypothetical protein